jgi:hypothetical protein
MKINYLVLSILTIGGLTGWSAKADVPMPMDNPISIDGVQTVCTGIGDEAQHDPRWLAYPVRIEFSNGGAQYLSGAHVVLSSSGGKTIAAVDCEGPWVLFQVGPGNYKVTATLTGQQGAPPASAEFSPPASGQKRVVLDFKMPANH